MNGQSRVRGIIWDVDGTLCDTLPLCIAAFREVFAKHLGRTLSDAEIVADFGITEAGMLRKRIPEGWQAAEREFLAVYARDHDASARLFPGVVDVLSTLRDHGVRQAIVTGKGPGSAAITLDRFDLRRFVDRVECGSPDGPIKPIGIRSILAFWNLPAREVAYVGDTLSDTRAANEVGVIALRAVWSETSGGEDDASITPAATLDSPAALLAWVFKTVTSPATPPPVPRESRGPSSRSP